MRGPTSTDMGADTLTAMRPALRSVLSRMEITMNDNPDKLRDLALTILRDHADELSWQAGSFCGQICACPDRPLSEKQSAWLARIAERAGLGERLAA